ncbi:MAG: hypothetical protein KDD22_08225, partial [Bdellovibrionales bacterium]|nr:hypothetical protein [Bdellovibrionales bacterium]
LWLTAEILKTLAEKPWAVSLMPDSLKKNLMGAASSVMKRTADPAYVGNTAENWFWAQVLMAQGAVAFGEAQINEQVTEVVTLAEANVEKADVSRWSNQELMEIFNLLAKAHPENVIDGKVYKALRESSRLVISGNQAGFPGKPIFNGLFYIDETITSAQFLNTFAKLKGSKDLARPLAIGLVNATASRWYIDRTLVWVQIALESFESNYESEAVNGSSALRWDVAQKTEEVRWQSAQQTETFVTPWKTSEENLRVTHSGKGHPWVSLVSLQAVPLEAPKAQGLQNEKSLRNVTRDDGTFQVGDVVEVTLQINASGMLRHVQMLDPIPAGSNILGEAYGTYTSGQKTYSGYQLSMEFVPQGASVVKYQFQLNSPGQFKLPPTHAEGVYLPSVFGDTPNATLTVK